LGRAYITGGRTEERGCILASGLRWASLSEGIDWYLQPSNWLRISISALLITLFAVTVTLLNASKPLQLDDTAYYYFARHIAAHPLDPYGLEIFWNDRTQPAFEVLAPPVLPYWWSIAIRLFGDNEFLWKLWLFPFAALLAVSCYDLLRRFAPAAEMPFIAFVLFSPVVLPSLNLMLDIPALALSLAALAILSRACDSRSAWLSLPAGFLAALAMETKYTALSTPAVMLAYAMIHGRTGRGVLASAVAFLLFCGCEGFLAWRYGHSHFLYHAQAATTTLRHKLELVQPLLTVAGGTLPFLGLLALLALRLSGKLLGMAATAVLAVYGLLLYTPASWTEMSLDLGFATLRSRQDTLLFELTGTAVWAAVLGCLAVLFMCRYVTRAGKTGNPACGADRISVFLGIWLLIELCSYFALSPFPAVRRFLGITVVVTFIVARMVSMQPWTSLRRQVFRTIICAHCALGFLYAIIDWRDAHAQRIAIQESLRSIGDHVGSKVWFDGHWGWQFYAERGGMRPVEPNKSEMHAGDYFILADNQLWISRLDLAQAPFEPIRELRIVDCLPLRTMPNYYCSLLPLRRFSGPRLRVQIFKLAKDFMPRTAP
jgi:hypothetical protein